MIDDATSRVVARFVRHDSTEENLRLLGHYLGAHGRPLAVYTDKASLFQTAPKGIHHRDAPAEPPTQIGRALRELGIGGSAAHSPQAKGRIERFFGTAQDRLVKGLRKVGARTLEQANGYLADNYLPLWERRFSQPPRQAGDAHRPLEAALDLDSVPKRRRLLRRSTCLLGWERALEMKRAREYPRATAPPRATAKCGAF